MIYEGVVRTCCIPYREIGRPGDVILILADHGTDPRVTQAFAMAASVLEMEPIVVTTPISSHDYHDPPVPAQRAVEEADLVHFLTSRYVVHSPWGRRLSKAGKRRVISDAVTFEMLTDGAVRADLDEVARWNDLVAARWEAASEAHLTSELGTNLTMSVEGRPGMKGGGRYKSVALTEDSELVTRASFQFPGGEAAVAPVEDSAEGVIVIDKTLQPIAGLLSEPVKLFISKGTITEIEGGHEARWFADWLDRYADDHGRRVCELAVGTNPAARWSGNLRQDRFVWGSSHLGFGMNIDVGGTIESRIHFDAAWSMPTIVLDGVPLVGRGRIAELVPEPIG